MHESLQPSLIQLLKLVGIKAVYVNSYDIDRAERELALYMLDVEKLQRLPIGSLDAWVNRLRIEGAFTLRLFFALGVFSSNMRILHNPSRLILFGCNDLVASSRSFAPADPYPSLAWLVGRTPDYLDACDGTARTQS